MLRHKWWGRSVPSADTGRLRGGRRRVSWERHELYHCEHLFDYAAAHGGVLHFGRPWRYLSTIDRIRLCNGTRCVPRKWNQLQHRGYLPDAAAERGMLSGESDSGNPGMHHGA